MPRITTLLSLLLLIPFAHLRAQTISGTVTGKDGKALADVYIQNIFNSIVQNTKADGAFTINAKPGELIEFKKMGYNTVRVRITSSSIPFYRIIMEQGLMLDGVEIRSPYSDYQRDSMRYRELFSKQLNFPTVTGWRAFQSPFSALSKSNKDMIRFQEEYAWLERQKYVDSRFNAKIISNLTGLKGDSLERYMRQYRPTYEFTRSKFEYDFFNYIRTTVETWRRRQAPSNTRGTGGG